MNSRGQARGTSAPPASPAERFDQLWQADNVPDLGAFVAGAGNLRASDLAALVHVDQRRRHARQLSLPAEFYLQRFGGLRDDSELALDVVYQEYALAREAGETSSPEVYLARFPDLAERLTLQFELDFAVASEYLPSSGTWPGRTNHLHATYTPGTIIGGRYKLLEGIGEGGMGTVWVAEQTEPVHRRVAIKLIKPGMDSHQVLSRFEIERQALAVMEHPNIAKVLDGGVTDQGRPFFVMEYVKGEPITEYCDRNRLTVRERLELFVAVCQAVQHAHQKGIIHRDLKPSNILVCPYDSVAVPKVIDFGLAKAVHQSLTEHTLYTAHGMIVGTPMYMSPEQARSNNLDIDTRSDVYSLGVILYELLTGGTPLEKTQFQNAAWHDVARLIAETEPPRPSTRLQGGKSLPTIAAQRRLDVGQFGRAVRGDLDWIVMKSLEKDRARRYATANNLARDLERYLADEPVEARPPSASYRFGKFARRNRAALVTAALVAGALVAGMAASTFQAARAKRAERLAEAARADEAGERRRAEGERNAADAARAAEAQQRKVAEFQQAEAEQNFQKARATVDEYFTLVSESTLLDVPGLQPLRKDLLEAALRFYEGSRRERTNDPELKANLAVTYLRLSQIYLALDRVDDCVAAARSALALVEQLRNEPAAAPHLRNLAGFWKGLRWNEGGLIMPRDSTPAVLTLLRLEANWKLLADTFPDEVGFQVDLALIQGLMGALLTWADRRDQANVYYRKAIAAGERVVASYPDNEQYREDMANLKLLLATNLVDTPAATEALALTRQAVALSEKLVAGAPAVPTYRSALVASLTLLGSQLWQTDSAEAVTVLGRAEHLGEALVREFPGQRVFTETWTKACVEHAVAAATAAGGDSAEITARLIETLDARLRQHGNESFRGRVALALRDLAEPPHIARRALERRPLLEASRDLFTELAIEFPQRADYLEEANYRNYALGWVHQEAGRGDQARPHFQCAADAFERLGALADDNLREHAIHALFALAVVEAQAGRFEAALAPTRRAVELSQALVAAYPGNERYRRQQVDATAALAQRLADAGQFDEAQVAQQTLFAQSERWLQMRPRPVAGDAHAAHLIKDLAEHWPSRGPINAREALLVRACELFKTLSVRHGNHPGHLETFAHLSRALAWLQTDDCRHALACQNQQAAVDAFAKLGAGRDGYYRRHAVGAQMDLALVRDIAGQPEAARDASQAAAEMSGRLADDVPQNAEFRALALHAQAVFARHRARTSTPDEARAVHDQLLPEIDALLQRHSDHPSVQAQVANALGELTWGPHVSGSICEALRRRKLAIHLKLAAQFPKETNHRHAAAQDLQHLAWLLGDAGRLGEARSNFEQSAAGFRQLMASGPLQRSGLYQSRYAESQMQVAALLALEGQHDEACRNGDEALDACNRVLEAFPDNAHYRQEAAEAYYDQATIRLACHDLAGYSATCREMVARLNPPRDNVVGYRLCSTCGLGPAAIAELGDVLTLAQQIAAEEPDKAEYVTALGLLYYRVGRLPEAAEQLAEALAIYDRPTPQGGSPFAARLARAMTWTAQGKLDDARRELALVVAVLDADPPPAVPLHLRIQLNLLRAEAEVSVAAAAAP